MIGKEDYIVIYDDEIGVVYSAVKGKAKVTTVKHARNLETALNDYKNNCLDNDSKEQLEAYLWDSFSEYPDLIEKEYKSLLESKYLRRLEVMVANDCNLNCKYCYAVAGSYKQKAQRMSPDVAKKFLENFILGRYEEIEIVQFFGGEPTLCPDTIEAICDFFVINVKKGLIKKIPDYTMITNGVLIDEKMAKIIAKHNIRLTISIDGPSKIHDILRMDKNGSGTFEKVKIGINNLKHFHVKPVMLEATYTTKHVELGYTKKMINEYLKKEFDVEKIMVADCEINDMDNSLAFTEEFCDEEVEDDVIDKFNKRTVIRSLKENGYKSGVCDAGMESVAIMPNGDLFPCHRFVEFPEYRIAYWNGECFDFKEYGNVLSKLESCKRWNNEKCKSCWAKSGCGICPATMLLSSSGVWDRMCKETYRIRKEYVLKCVKTYSNKKEERKEEAEC